ncbi:hypothetical protein LCGC14_1815360 [marine sediment metagenome]|uniref:Uncharacterized protein n=1 Tax=marine sediment metagenome TaxID=412755 RepID=A0A0F9H8N6_9ZZZZ
MSDNELDTTLYIIIIAVYIIFWIIIPLIESRKD